MIGDALLVLVLVLVGLASFAGLLLALHVALFASFGLVVGDALLGLVFVFTRLAGPLLVVVLFGPLQQAHEILDPLGDRIESGEGLPRGTCIAAHLGCLR